VAPSEFDRRSFLRAGAVGVAAIAVGSTLADCGGPSHKAAAHHHVVPATASQWAALDSSLSGRLVRRGDPAFRSDRLLYNPKFDGLVPLAIAYCTTTDDVARTVGFAVDHGVALAVRCGGHSYGGYSSGTGRLVVDVASMSAVRPAGVTGGTATVGAGARLIDVYNALGDVGQLVPGGSCPTVGIAGLTLGGGVGVFARQFGLACDALESVELVTADGTIRRCSASEHAELFWACQGGGGGNFGVATSFEFRTRALPDVTLFTYDFDFAGAHEVLGAWQRWNAHADPEVWSNCQLLSGGGTLVRVSGVACGSTGFAASALAPLLRDAPTPVDSFLGGSSYVNAMMVEAGCSALAVAACHLEGTTPSGVLSRQAFTASSNYVAAPMDDARLAATVDAVATLADQLGDLGGGLVFDALGGAVNDVAPESTAFVHRTSLASIQSSYNWTALTPLSQIAGGSRWLEHVRATVYDPTSGAYQNYIDPTQPDWATAYYGANLGRLERVKRAVDPDDVFRFAQSIPVAP
jgi:FAD/FMN-containing dehydrogenase